MIQATLLQSHTEAKGKGFGASPPQPHMGPFSCPAFKGKTLQGISCAEAQGCDPTLAGPACNKVSRMEEK